MCIRLAISDFVGNGTSDQKKESFTQLSTTDIKYLVKSETKFKTRAAQKSFADSNSHRCV